MGPFEFGNTTVRSAIRLRDGLIAVEQSGKEGSLRGRSGDLDLIRLLEAAEVIDHRGDVTNSVGRKWRAAMCKLGLLFDKYETGQESIGEVDFITPLGRQLIAATSLSAQQESYLRAVAGMELAFVGQHFEVGPGFSPFKHLVKLMFELEKKFESSTISFIEFACFAQFDPAASSYEATITLIEEHRRNRKDAPNKKKYDTKALEAAVTRHGRVALSSYIDYADENIRYLKSTGCFSTVGRGIGLSTHKIEVLKEIVSTEIEFATDVEYWKTITTGISLPTDNIPLAIKALSEIQHEAVLRGIPVVELNDFQDVKKINSARFDAEELVALDMERDFAKKQVLEWKEIIYYLTALLPQESRGSELLQSSDIEIPRGEGPAYLEWAVWRAFLAINHLRNAPFESRRFPIDRDFLPTNHAPGKGPDLIFEFESYFLIVEVTLLTTDRQASAEQVGVRRHVYEIAKSTQVKPVYCLFLAPFIKNETARDFKKATYEEDDGSALDLTIIPVKLSTFVKLFYTMLKSNRQEPEAIQRLLLDCASVSTSDITTGEWMSTIEERFLAYA
jgi:hypothetical protein